MPTLLTPILLRLALLSGLALLQPALAREGFDAPAATRCADSGKAAI